MKRASSRKRLEAPEPPPQPAQQLNEAGRKVEVLYNMMEWGDICTAHGMKTKSAMIRWLWADGYSRSAIAKFMGCKYQMVRNILTQQPKKPVEPTGD